MRHLPELSKHLSARHRVLGAVLALSTVLLSTRSIRAQELQGSLKLHVIPISINWSRSEGFTVLFENEIQLPFGTITVGFPTSAPSAANGDRFLTVFDGRLSRRYRLGQEAFEFRDLPAGTDVRADVNGNVLINISSSRPIQSTRPAPRPPRPPPIPLSPRLSYWQLLSCTSPRFGTFGIAFRSGSAAYQGRLALNGCSGRLRVRVADPRRLALGGFDEVEQSISVTNVRGRVLLRGSNPVSTINLGPSPWHIPTLEIRSDRDGNWSLYHTDQRGEHRVWITSVR